MMSIEIKTVDYCTQKKAIQAIRIAVFQVEQGVDPHLEFDQYDETATHFLAYLNDEAVGTTRVRYLLEDTVKLERLAVLPSARKQGMGLQLMQFTIDFIRTDPSVKYIIIHAQAYLKGFYEKLGFSAIGEPFEEAGIPHLKMIKILS